MKSQEALIIFLVLLVAFVVLFLVFRELVCWYWKINRSVELLTEIRDLLSARNLSSASASIPFASGRSANSTPPVEPTIQPEPDTGPRGICSACQSEIPLNSIECPNRKCKAQFAPAYPLSLYTVKPL